MYVQDVNPRPSREKLTLRAERAAVTRRRIAEAARRLFVRDGYGATTLHAIADEAGVAVQTVYAVYGSKATILRQLRDEVVFQPDADALAGAAMGQPDAGELDAGARLLLFARSIRIRWAAGGDVVMVDREAASTDPSLRAEQAAVYARRRAGLARLAASLEGGLVPGLGVERATAILDALTLPDIYAELVGIHGWTPGEYESWLVETLGRALLGLDIRAQAGAHPGDNTE